MEIKDKELGELGAILMSVLSKPMRVNSNKAIALDIAADELNELEIKEYNRDGCRHQWIEEAHDAVLRALPEFPYVNEDGFTCCPVCDRDLPQVKDMKHCPYCGQRLDEYE